ncbi:unnamed protein product [Ceratitis capitata]|uniref:(Mediterranean fruit fly) hypothetical protein n=1 Tax=Ceratitis capitata TaxID=7213 RepID=A0A811VA08_CERCA|nr:unnamed protein product [Ceratitis capitata]
MENSAQYDPEQTYGVGSSKFKHARTDKRVHKHNSKQNAKKKECPTTTPAPKPTQIQFVGVNVDEWVRVECSNNYNKLQQNELALVLLPICTMDASETDI